LTQEKKEGSTQCGGLGKGTTGGVPSEGFSGETGDNFSIDRGGKSSGRFRRGREKCVNFSESINSEGEGKSSHKTRFSSKKPLREGGVRCREGREGDEWFSFSLPPPNKSKGGLAEGGCSACWKGGRTEGEIDEEKAVLKLLRKSLASVGRKRKINLQDRVGKKRGGAAISLKKTPTLIIMKRKEGRDGRPNFPKKKNGLSGKRKGICVERRKKK